MSCLTSTAQCTRDTSASSTSMSAPPPNRPIVTSGRDKSNSFPRDGPVITEILIVLSCGSVRLDVRESRAPAIRASFDLSCGFAELTAIVGGPISSVGDSNCLAAGESALGFERETLPTAVVESSFAAEDDSRAVAVGDPTL